jgi:hypothetical protein
MLSMLATRVVDTSGKFTTGVVGTGGDLKFQERYM